MYSLKTDYVLSSSHRVKNSNPINFGETLLCSVSIKQVKCATLLLTTVHAQNLLILQNFSAKELMTTLTLLSAMRIPATLGGSMVL